MKLKIEFTDSVTVSFTIICCIVKRNTICYGNICFNNNVILVTRFIVKVLTIAKNRLRLTLELKTNHATGSVTGFSTAGFIKSLEL